METTLFTRNLMRGLHDGFVDGGRSRPYINDDVATGVFDKVASDMGVPPVLSEHLPTQVYIKIGQALISANDLAAQNGLCASPQDEMLAKQAASMDLADRALVMAAFYMDKAAEEASLNAVGSNTPESAVATNSIARLDQMNRSSLQYLVGMGQTDMPEAGVVGRQMPHPMAPKGPAINNSLSHLDKQAALKEAEEKVSRALVFMDGLANRGAEISNKTVLASAILADAGTTGLEVMASIVGNTKTAEELDHHLDSVLEAGHEQGEAADPHLVKAIQNALEAHSGEGDEGDEEHEEKSAGLAGDLARKGKKQIREAGRKVEEGIRRATGTETPGMKAREALEKGKEKVKDLGRKAKKKVEEGYDAVKDMTVDEAIKAGKVPAGLVAGGAAAGAAAGALAARKKESALLDFLKAAADGSLNEVDENTPEDAAHYNANAELDMENRKPKEYLEGMGKSELPNVGHRGKAMDAPKGPEKVMPDNVASRETLKAASFEYKVKAAAEFWGPKLPATMPQSEKRAHVIALAGMPEDMQSGYISSLYGR